jgi:hypothetical protein
VFAAGSRIREIHCFMGCELFSRIEIRNDSSIPNLQFFIKSEKFLVLRKISKECSILFEVCSGCYMIDEPLSDIFELARRMRESDILNVDEERVSISNISDRLFCLFLLRSIELPTFIHSIRSCLRSMDMIILNVVIPSSIEEIDGFFGFNSVEFLSFGDGRCVREIDGLFCCESLRRIEIPALTEFLRGFHHRDGLTDIIFESEGHLREIDGFDKCKSLARIDIPRSTEFISGFNSCNSLIAVVFEPVSRVREINGFNDCKSLPEIEIAASVEILRGFNDCKGLKKIQFTANGCLRVIKGFNSCLTASITIPASVEIIKGLGSRSISHFIFEEGTMIKTIETGRVL